MPKTYCPECDAAITVGSPRVGADVVCGKCDTKLEIISTDPFEVDFPLGYFDDEWDDEEGEDEEEA
jgi:lysine biosynthesis protein LysW